MSFIHPLLLAGLVLLGLPVVIHLIMRQQPKHLLFPALRFLKLQQRTNQRKLRLRHLLLLILRMLLIALMCLALARPRLFSDRLRNFLGSDQAVAVVLVVDTSPSMEYTVAGQTCLEAARARALELLDELSATSRVAVIDTADPVPEWAASLAAARDRLVALEIRPANHPVTDGLSAALQLFEPSAVNPLDEQPLPRFVYVFSDRTPHSWDAARASELKARRERLAPVPKCVFVDVGVEEPVDLAITDVVMRPQVVPANRTALLRVHVQATGDTFNTAVKCQFDGEPRIDRKPVDLTADAGEVKVVTKVVEFERGGFAPGWHTAEVSVDTADSLAGDNFRYVTFEVREPQKVLVICDDRQDAKMWASAVNSQKYFQCDVREKADGLPSDLANYRAVCLLSVTAPSDTLRALDEYVKKGVGLLVAPPIGGLNREEYNRWAGGLLPAEFPDPDPVDKRPRGVAMTAPPPNHPLTARLAELTRDTHIEQFTRAYRYWSVKPSGGNVLLRFDDEAKPPALLERAAEAAGGRGKVLLFTTAFDDRRDNNAPPLAATDSASTWFYQVLVNESLRYVAGEGQDASFNHLCGQTVVVPLPPAPRYPTYTLQGPGLRGADTTVTRAEDAGEIRLTQPRLPGHYTVTGGGKLTAAFSLNLQPGECQLLPRLTAGSIEEVFGPESLVSLGQTRKLREAMEGQFKQPVELFPWLMLLLLVALAVENWLANKFYRKPAGEMTNDEIRMTKE
jgi:Aerotolerance regulator N-terminal